MKVKKAQAALEFLMTYGWAILVVLVVIGALAYFGVLNPSILLPEKCTLQLGMSCLDHRIDSDTDQINLKLRNGMGRDIIILNISAIGDALQGACETGVGNYDYILASLGVIGCEIGDCTQCTGFPGTVDSYYLCNPHHIAEYFTVTNYNQAAGMLFQIGQTVDITLNCTNPVLRTSGKTKIALTLIWYNADSSAQYTHTMRGELLAAVEG